MIYCPVGVGGVGGGLITSHKVGGCVLQEDEGEGADRGKEERGGVCERERGE